MSVSSIDKGVMPAKSAFTSGVDFTGIIVDVGCGVAVGTGVGAGIGVATGTGLRKNDGVGSGSAVVVGEGLGMTESTGESGPLHAISVMAPTTGSIVRPTQPNI